MAYPEPNSRYVLHTDASESGLGAVLYQEQNRKLRVIPYGSRTLTAAEKNYHLHSGKLEFLAMKWAICEQFRDYLYYAPSFVVFTNNNPLTYVLSTAKLDSSPRTNKNYPQYVSEWRKAMQEACQVARQKSTQSGMKAKKYYDHLVRSSVLQPGDRVLVRNLSERGGPGKLRSFWENDIHVVVRRKGPDSPVYEVKAETNGTKIRVLHRNLLLPCNYLPVEEPLTDPAWTVSRRQLHKRQNQSLTNPAASKSKNVNIH
ncbi:Hypothetical predicted protein [Paramuricea clavata]|uniref:Reverse transcriptase RNase H-like domain-containing protein n=1 Tax=Paramuricea clavata TaxID=317549 RepID=A0A6S7IY38_PARCT|nr:Hypothetical predicted protein [Paramuricea clavata]